MDDDVKESRPREINDWQKGEPVPPGYHPTTRVSKGFVIVGSIVFGVFYQMSVFAALFCGANLSPTNAAGGGSGNCTPWLLIPAVGPFVEMTNRSSALGNWVLAVDGIEQCGGLTMLVYGIAARRTVLDRDDLGLHILPSLDRGGGGLRVFGVF